MNEGENVQVSETDESRLRALFLEHREALQREVQKATRAGARIENLVGFIIDGDAPFLRSEMDRRGVTERGTAVSVVERAEALRLVQTSDAIGAALASATAGSIDVVIMSGAAISVSSINLKSSAPIRNTPSAVERADGEFCLNASGMLRFLFEVDLSEVTDGPRRDEIRRFQERVRGLIGAEAIRAHPRCLDDILFDECGGVRIIEQIRAQDAAGAMATALSSGGRPS